MNNNQVEVSYEQVDEICRACGIVWSGQSVYRKVNNPLKPGSDSKAFSLTIERSGDKYTGAYFYHVDQSKGSLLELWELLGGVSTSPSPTKAHRSASKRLETTKPTQSTQSAPNVAKPVYTTLEEYARGHGVDSKYFIEAGWRETNRGGRKALVYPTRNGERFRFLDGKEPKYIHNTGYKNCWYRLEEALVLARAKRKPLVICNGEASTIVAQAFGIPATAPTGGEKPKLPEALLQELLDVYPTRQKEKITILVALDCDDTGRASAIPLALQLEKAGYEARALDLGLELNHGDLADYLQRFTVEQFYQLPSLPDPQAVPLLDGIFRSGLGIQIALENGEEVPQRVIVSTPEGEAWLTTGCHVLGGRPKSMKSWLALHIATTIADGGVLFGDTAWATVQGASVYLDFEMQASKALERMNKMGVSESLQYMTSSKWRALVAEHPDMDHTDLARIVVKQWSETLPAGAPRGVVVVDTVSSIVSATYARGADQSTVDFRYYKAWDNLAVELDVCILLVTHMTKGYSKGQHPTDAFFGSGKLQGAYEGGHALVGGDGSGQVVVHTKGRDLTKEISLIFDDNAGHHITRGAPAVIKQEPGTVGHGVLMYMLSTDKDVPIEELIEKLGNASAVRVAVHRLVDKGDIFSVGRGIYRISKR